MPVAMSSISVEQALALNPGWTALAALACIGVFQALGWVLWQCLPKNAVQVDPTHVCNCPLLTLFFQQALGMGGAMLLLLVLALGGAFRAAFVLTAAMAVVAMATALRWSRGPVSTAAHAKAAVVPREWLVLACAALLTAASAWHFPTAWDDTSYHLPLARAIVDSHGLVANEWLRFPYFPAYMQLLFAAGLLLDVSLAQWLATWPVALVLLGLMGAARWLCGNSSWGVLSWVAYVCSPATQHSLGSAYVDAGLTLFCLASVLAASVWAQEDAQTRVWRWLVLAGIFAGVASGIKFHGLVVAAAVGLVVLGRSIAAGTSIPAVGNGMVFGAACLGICAFWYARSYCATGDPVHPAGAAWFGYYLWTPEDMALQLAEQASHGLPKAWRYFLEALWQVRVPYLYAALALPMLCWVTRKAWAWLMIGLVVWSGLLFWFWVSQVDRYLLTVLPAGALLCAGTIHCIAGMPLSKAPPTAQILGRRMMETISVLAAVVLAAGAVEALRERPPITAQRESHEEIALLQQAEHLSDLYGTRVLNLGYENAFFYYRGQLIGDWFGRAAFPLIADCRATCRLREPRETRAAMQRLDTQLLLVNADKFPFDEAQYGSEMQLLARKGQGFLFGITRLGN